MSSNVILREAMDFLNELESLRAEVAARDAYFKKIKKSKDKEEMARYQKMADDINYAKQNNTILYWVKDDKVESLQQVEKDMNEILNYHINIIEYFNKFSEMERNFYCGETLKNTIDGKNIKIVNKTIDEDMKTTIC